MKSDMLCTNRYVRVVCFLYLLLFKKCLLDFSSVQIVFLHSNIISTLLFLPYITGEKQQIRQLACISATLDGCARKSISALGTYGFSSTYRSYANCVHVFFQFSRCGCLELFNAPLTSSIYISYPHSSFYFLFLFIFFPSLFSFSLFFSSHFLLITTPHSPHLPLVTG